MGKELVISSNRHETKLAVLEDDQLVEVYFQRSNEYSLAGSIHKGRVTRVLPGMQSAFVDIGLERDAFLYVSDFFEDNEEYERVAGAAEEQALKSDREGRSAPAVSPPAPPPVAVAPLPAPPAAEPAPSDEGDRKNRRSRRRRTRGRGFPDSKYADVAPPRPRTYEPPPAPPPPLRQSDDDFFVLPGETLAKYRHPESEPVSGDAGEPYETPEAETTPLHEELAITDPNLGMAPPEAEPAVPETGFGAAGFQPAPEPEPEPEEPLPQGVVDREPSAEEPVILAELPDQAIPEAPEFAELAESSEPAAPAEAGGQAAGEEEVEPARMPVSLTATLREQGHRYMHRVSRRMRRKMRSETREPQAPAPTPERRAEPESAPEGKTNGRTRPERERPPQPSISELLREGQEVLVQIAKEPLGQKGARITSHIALPGRYVVYMPTVEHLGVSRKISSDEERLRLKRILQTHRTGMPGGFIVRTAGEGKTEDEVAADMRFLFNLWLDIRQKSEARPAPALIHHDLDLVSRVLRDQMTESFKTVWVDNEEVYEHCLRFVERFHPGAVNRVKLYTRSTPIYDAFNITPELEKALRPKVWLKSGGYIVINQTEALVAIDVNTGKFVGKSNRLEDTIVKTNTEAVKEIVRQVRLRDLGGIIVVDFIDMDERKNRQKVMQALEEAMRADRAPNKILQFNDFGLVAITRKRVKQSLERTLCAPCPYCEGAAYVKSVQTVIGEILQEAHKIKAAVQDSKDVMLRVNPEVAKVLKSSDNDYLEELEEILRRPVIITSDPALHQEKFDLV